MPADVFKIDKSEVLRYLGHRGQVYDNALDGLIDDCIAQCESLARVQYTYGLFDLGERDGILSVAGTRLLLPGADIARHLHGAKKCALLAATLGTSIDRAIAAAQRDSMTRALVLDACANDLIEKACDRAQEEIAAKAQTDGLFINFRFSPGYGDLPLSIQPDFLRVLKTDKVIGLTCTDTLILLPRKSVTAVIGLFDEPLESPQKPGCASCRMAKTCTFRKDGGSCGNFKKA